MKGKFPNFKELIKRDEERWLADHYSRKDRIGKSTKLDEQLQALLKATGTLDTPEDGLRGPLSPPTITGIERITIPLQKPDLSDIIAYGQSSSESVFDGAPGRGSTPSPVTWSLGASIGKGDGEEDAATSAPAGVTEIDDKHRSCVAMDSEESLNGKNGPFLCLPLAYNFDAGKTTKQRGASINHLEEIKIDSPRVTRVFTQKRKSI